MRASLTLVLGPGGVGKTTMSAAIALAAAQRGERTAVVTVDPAKRLAQALGHDHLPHRPEPVAGQENFFAATLDRPRAWDEMVARCAENRGIPAEQVARLHGNRFYKHLRDELGGSAEIIYADYLGQLLETGQFDRVVIDTPPAHDALGFLDAGERFARFVDAKILELLIGGSGFKLSRRLVLKVLSRLTGRELLDDLIDFLTLTQEIFAYMAQRGRAMGLRQQGAQMLLVTAPDREGEVAGRKLAEALDERGLDLQATIANRIVGPPPAEAWTGEVDSAWIEFGRERSEAVQARADLDEERIDGLRNVLRGVPVYPVARLVREPECLDDLRAIAAQVPATLVGGQ